VSTVTGAPTFLPDVSEVRKALPSVSENLVRNFNSVASSARVIDPSLAKRKGRLQIIFAKSDDVFAQADSWTQFSKRFGGARSYLVLSPVAYEKNGESALLSTQFSCGPTCGVEILYLLDRGVDRRWRVLGDMRMGVS
jgi:hypothetical protein